MANVIFRKENKTAGRMLAYMDMRGMLPSGKLDLIGDDYKIPRESLDIRIEGNDYIARIARHWRNAYSYRDPNERFFPNDIFFNYLEAKDYYKLITRMRTELDEEFWDAAGRNPIAMDALNGLSLLPTRSKMIFSVLMDFPSDKRIAAYKRLCRILWDWDSIERIGFNESKRTIADIIESDEEDA